jgi:hypothetical protein
MGQPTGGRRVVGQRGQRLVQLVREARGHLADHGEPSQRREAALRSEGLAIAQHALRDVLHRADEHGVAAFGRERTEHGAHAAVAIRAHDRVLQVEIRLGVAECEVGIPLHAAAVARMHEARAVLRDRCSRGVDRHAVQPRHRRGPRCHRARDPVDPERGSTTEPGQLPDEPAGLDQLGGDGIARQHVHSAGGTPSDSTGAGQRRNRGDP